MTSKSPVNLSEQTISGDRTSEGSSDSAPPPAKAPDAFAKLPPRSSAALPASVVPIVQVYAPNRAIPAFIRFLAVFIFLVGGSLSAASTWIYKTFIYPRLVLALEGMTTVHQKQLGSYDLIMQSLRKFAGSQSIIALHGTPVISSTKAKDGALVQENLNSLNEMEKPKTKDQLQPSPTLPIKEPQSTSQELSTEEPKSMPISVPNTLNLEPVRDCLKELRSLTASTLPSSNVEITSEGEGEATTEESPSELATDRLSTSLSKCQEFLTSESYSSYSSAYRSTYSTIKTPATEGRLGQNALQDAVGSLKTEIRAVKGALLNRRNFAMGPKIEGPPQVS